jgi:hypothetical protein
MKIVDIVKGVNSLLAGELLSQKELQTHLDSVIDDINRDLNATFPAFSELPATVTEYTAFPDQYLRKVVFPGVAYYFYMMDEEGAQSAPAYQDKYNMEKFFMIRDYLSRVPEQYKRPVLAQDVFAPDVEYGIDMSVFKF